MNYWGDGLGKVVCAVDMVHKGGEFTICGNNCIDAGRCQHDDWDIIGGVFDGTLKKVTCPNCLNFINFIKGLK
jgi:hypothetical protein